MYKIKASQYRRMFESSNKLNSQDLSDDSYYGAVLDNTEIDRELGTGGKLRLRYSGLMAIIRCISNVVAIENNESLIAEHTERILNVIPEYAIPFVMDAIKAVKDANNI